MPSISKLQRTSEEAKRLRAVADEHVFRLLIVIKHHLVIFTADTRLLVATERGMRRISVIAVRPHATGLDSTAHAIGARTVPGPHPRAKAVERVICNREGFLVILKRRHRQNGSEDFLLEHAHLVVTFKNRRLDVVAGCKFASEVGTLAAGQNTGTFALADFNVAQDLFELIVRSLGADH